MCGRFTLARPGEVIDEVFEALESTSESASVAAALDLGARYNIAPTQPVPVVHSERDAPLLEVLRWGIPAATSEQRPRARLLINARAETVAERPSFRDAFRHRRCLILADGFYEWRTRGSRQPFYFRPEGRRSLCFAGLRETSPNSDSPDTCCLVTTQANAVVATVHDRMPVILEPHNYTLWINDALRDPARLQELLHPAPPGLLHSHPVSSAVNRVAIDGPSLLEPVAEAPPPPENLSLF